MNSRLSEQFLSKAIFPLTELLGVLPQSQDFDGYRNLRHANYAINTATCAGGNEIFWGLARIYAFNNIKPRKALKALRGLMLLVVSEFFTLLAAASPLYQMRKDVKEFLQTGSSRLCGPRMYIQSGFLPEMDRAISAHKLHLDIMRAVTQHKNGWQTNTLFAGYLLAPLPMSWCAA